MPRFLALKASIFLAQIYFLDLAVFDFFSLYNFSVLTFFYLNLLPGLFNYFTLDFCFLFLLRLLNLLLKLFLVWRWVELPIY